MDKETKDPGIAKFLEESIDALESKQTPPPVETPAQPASEPSSRPAAVEEPDKTTGVPGLQRERDGQGRFVKKQGEVAPAEPQAPTQAAPKPEPVAPKPEDTVPASWKDDVKPHWEKIPAEVRGYLHQRERELQSGFQQVAQRANIAEAVLNEFIPYADTLQKEGATPVTAIRTLLQTAHALRTGEPEYRKAIILSLAQQYGVDLGKELNFDLASAQAKAATFASERMYSSAQNERATQHQVEQEYQAFANDPKNEYFPQVRGIMGHLIASGIAQDLASAYQMSLGMHPEVRQKLMDKEFDRKTAAAAEETRRRTAANVSVSGSPNGSMTPSGQEKMNLRETIERAMQGVDRL